MPVIAEARTDRVRSADGTSIAFERIGNGPPVILIDPALCDRATGQSRALAATLAPRFTVFVYDRRGRGESGDTKPYAVEREIEDVAALLDVAGGEAYVWSMSSGAVLALDAARELSAIRRVALYEPPLIVDASHPAMDASWRRIDEAVAAGRPGDAVATFLRAVGVPAPVLWVMRLTSMWRRLERLAPTLPYDGAILRGLQQGQPLPVDRWSGVRIPTLVTYGGKSRAWMRRGSEALADVLPNATVRAVEGQTHKLVATAHAPMLAEFFG